MIEIWPTKGKAGVQMGVQTEMKINETYISCGFQVIFRAVSHLDVYYCPARVLQLRKLGFNIVTHWQTVITEAGEKHRVGLYVLESGVSDEAA